MKKLLKNRRTFSNLSPARLWAIVIVTLIVSLIYVGRLMNLQIASHEYYSALTQPKIVKRETLETTRGEILDTNGVPLVTNEIHYDLRFNRANMPYGEENSIIAGLLRFFDRHGIAYSDNMPVNPRAPFNLKPDYDTYGYRKFVKAHSEKFVDKETKEEIDITEGENFYRYAYQRYGLDKLSGIYNENQLRRICGMRYDLEVSDFSVAYPFTILSDIDTELILSISDILHDIPGVEIVTTAERVYNQGSLAAHVLGRLGPITAENKNEYIEKGYNLNARVGISGAEMAFEEYLRGIDGEKSTEYASDGVTVVGTNVSEEAKEGKTIRLTLDTGMQKIAEHSLDRVIHATAELGRAKVEYDGKEYQGEDANSGAVVVLDVNDFSVRAMASYPSYDQNTYQEEISALLVDKDSPLLNRATRGIYPPGSTFKPLTAAAALTKGTIDSETEIECLGKFTAFDDYQPGCWLWNSLKKTHGPITVSTALAVSCNYFFYQLGKDVGITYLDEYAKSFGFGEKTGIEIGEDTGVLAGPESREARGFLWNPGDAIQAAIGQSDHAFTPIQLATFMATLVNGGTRYKTHLLQSVHTYTNGEIAQTVEPVVLNQVNLDPLHLKQIKEGMKRVVEDNGTAAEVFEGYIYPIGGKTGTAQVGKGSETAVFVGFAPFDDPQIAVAVVIEHGHAGNVASEVAKDIFTYYFES